MKNFTAKPNTLKQLEAMTFVTEEGEPATLYQIIIRPFDNRVVSALESAKNGDSKALQQLIDEVNVLLDQFTRYREYLWYERAMNFTPSPALVKHIEEVYVLLHSQP